MSWLKHHTLSEEYASKAENFYRQQESIHAVKFYCLAAEEEAKALENLDTSKTRTIGITVVSAASLYYKAQEFLQAKRISHKWLATDLLPTFAIDELEELIQVIHYEESRAKSGIEFTKGEVLVSVSGGEVLYGAAPLELILEKVENIKNILYRTTEFLLSSELRKRGSPTDVVKNYCDPWLFQAPPGSYQFAVRVRKPQAQLTIPGLPDIGLRMEQITEKFLEIMTATTQDPEGELVEIVPQEDYRETFLKLTRNLAPPLKGNSFNQMEIKSATDIGIRPVILVPDTRGAINYALKKPVIELLQESPENKVINLTGILRGLQLDKDWIEVSINGENIKIYDAKEEIDDVIGRMVNRRIVVEVLDKSDKATDKRYTLRDIQLEEDLV
jgi:hypothetical protein